MTYPERYKQTAQQNNTREIRNPPKILMFWCTLIQISREKVLQMVDKRGELIKQHALNCQQTAMMHTK